MERGNPGCPAPHPECWSLEALKKEQEYINEQIAEDTCSTHNVFCCPICFNGPE